MFLKTDVFEYHQLAGFGSGVRNPFEQLIQVSFPIETVVVDGVPVFNDLPCLSPIAQRHKIKRINKCN